MATVRVLDNKLNSGWNVGDEVELKGPTLKKWLDLKAVEVLKMDKEEEKEKDKSKNPALTQDRKAVNNEEPKDKPGKTMLGSIRDRLKDGDTHDAKEPKK